MGPVTTHCKTLPFLIAATWTKRGSDGGRQEELEARVNLSNIMHSTYQLRWDPSIFGKAMKS